MLSTGNNSPHKFSGLDLELDFKFDYLGNYIYLGTGIYSIDKEITN